MKRCKVRKCNGLVEVEKHGICKAHANRLYKKGDVGDGRIKRRRTHKPLVIK